MQLYRFLVMMHHPQTGRPTPISTLMAETGKQAERRAKALFTDQAWVVSEASHRVDDGMGEKLLGRFWAEDQKWRRTMIDEEDVD